MKNENYMLILTIFLIVTLPVLFWFKIDNLLIILAWCVSFVGSIYLYYEEKHYIPIYAGATADNRG